MPYCKVCGSELPAEAKFCPKCGATVTAAAEGIGAVEGEFPVVTTPSIPGYRVVKFVGVVSGLSPRTRGVLGKFIGGIQSAFGGEVTAFTSEIEKARQEAIERMKAQARAMGANAIIGLDMETADLLQTLIVVTATGTAVVAEPEGK